MKVISLVLLLASWFPVGTAQPQLATLTSIHVTNMARLAVDWAWTTTHGPIPAVDQRYIQSLPVLWVNDPQVWDLVKCAVGYPHVGCYNGIYIAVWVNTTIPQPVLPINRDENPSAIIIHEYIHAYEAVTKQRHGKLGHSNSDNWMCPKNDQGWISCVDPDTNAVQARALELLQLLLTTPLD